MPTTSASMDELLVWGFREIYDPTLVCSTTITKLAGDTKTRTYNILNPREYRLPTSTSKK